MRAVNLLPVDARAGRRRPPTAAIAVAAFGVLAATLLAVGYMSGSSQLDKREQELSGLEQELAATRRAAQPKPTQPTRSAEQEQRLAALSTALGERLAWDRVLREVSLVVPDDVWLSSLGAGGATATPPTEPTAGQTLTFNGFTYTQEGVARLLTRLELVPHLDGIKLQKSSVTEVGSQQIYGFTILANVTSGGGTP